jgi:shikimate dehydrogenase|tara:strand:+ start:261 stop:989 length:729 start_codon:yes stop_codon:yes gene_type:complete
MSHKLGLIGYPLTHSFSPSYFEEKFKELNIQDSEYLAYSIEEIGKISEVFESGVTGLNVTIPYKELVIPFLDELSEGAAEVGAVNTIKIENGLKIGYNTDVYGFQASLLEQLGDTKIEKALILGSGGASKAVKYVLNKLGIKYKIVSRKKIYLTYDKLDAKTVQAHKLIVNTTPLGMYPNVDNCPLIPYDGITNQHFLYDLVYNPEKTLFLRKGESAGCSIKNGNDMLVLQAEKSWEIWNQK